MKEMSFAEAISDATVLAMKKHLNVYLLGIGLDYSSGVFGTTSEAFKLFGRERVLDTPAMENALTGIAAGASLCGMRPVVVHARNDFMFLALDQVLNVLAKWYYMFGGNASSMPVVIRAIIGRGWGQGATHSQSIQSAIAHFPGIRVVMPSRPQDAKGMLLSALESPDPVLILEHRNLYSIVEGVEEGWAHTSLSGAEVVQEGCDITVVASSVCVKEAILAGKDAEKVGIKIEVIDVRSLQPLDSKTILNSVKKTQRLIIMDTSWNPYGLGSEICAILLECGVQLRSKVIRLGQALTPAPVSRPLEDAHYPTANSLLESIHSLLESEADLQSLEVSNLPRMSDGFIGPY